MTAIALGREGTGRWWRDLGTTLVETVLPSSRLLYSSQSTPRRSEYESRSDDSDVKAIVRQALPMGVDASYIDLLHNSLPGSLAEVTAAVSQDISAAVEAITMSIANANDAALSLNASINEALPLFALSVEPVLLQLTYIEPHFTWSDEVEIDPLDDLE